MNKTIGERIAALRREKGLKQDELAEKLGVSPQAVSKWENDISCPDIMVLRPLAEILGVTVDELLGGERPESDVRQMDAETRKDVKDMILRVIVTSYKGDVVRVNLPMPIVISAVDMGLSMESIAGVGVDRGSDVDLERIVKLVESGVVGKLVEIESYKGDTVEIIVE